MASFEHHDFEKSIDYFFTDLKLLAEALRHSSFVNEQADPQLRDNERLEFLGDAVLSHDGNADQLVPGQREIDGERLTLELNLGLLGGATRRRRCRRGPCRRRSRTNSRRRC